MLDVADSFEVGIVEAASDSVAPGSVLLYPELSAGSAVVLERNGPVGKAEELLLKAPAEVGDSGTDVVAPGADVTDPPPETVTDGLYKLVPRIGEDPGVAAVREESREFVGETRGVEVLVQGM